MRSFLFWNIFSKNIIKLHDLVIVRYVGIVLLHLYNTTLNQSMALAKVGLKYYLENYGSCI